MRLDEKLKIIYETIAPTITRSEEAWKGYLQFGSTVYKHSFDNALLVYAQNPKATMLATFDVWKHPKVGRSINKDEKGIAVCEYQSANLTIKHLFDVTQTNGKTVPAVWKPGDGITAGLLNRLNYSRGIKADTLADCIGQVVDNTLTDKADEYMRGFENDVQDHFLGGLPKDGLTAEIEELIGQSCKYFIACRCGIETDGLEMPTISHFDTIPLIARLGYAVTEISKGILLEIERSVKILESERSAKHEQRTYRQQGASRTHQQLGDRGRSGSAARQVRQDGDETSARNRPPKVFTFEDAGRAYEPDVPGGRGSGGASREDSAKTPDTRPAAANRGHTGTDAPPEQAQGHSGGNRNQRNGADTEITEPEREPQGSFSLPETAGPLESDSIFIPPVDDENIIKAELLRGGPFQNGKKRIHTFIGTNPPASEFARFLKDEYGIGGHTGDRTAGILSVDHDSVGLHFRVRDDNSEAGERTIKLTWSNVTKRITELVNNGEYMPEQTVAESEGTPLWREYSALTEQYPDSVVFKRLGDFYEVMGDKASAVADELVLALTRRDVGLSERVLMIGVPSHTIDDYKNKLIDMGYSVVVADAETVTEYNPAETELSAENEIDGYAIPDEPESFGRSHDNAAEQLSLYSSGEQMQLSFTEPEPEQELPDEKENALRLTNELLNAHNGQLDLQIQAFMGENRVGVIYYSVFESVPSISFIEVYEDYRRQGIGTAMMQYLAGQYPGIEIEWGMLTEDGAAFKEAVTYTVENEEYTEAESRLTEINEQLARYDTTYNGTTIPNDVADDWNDLEDEKYNLENRLAELSPVKTFIKQDAESEPERASSAEPAPDPYRDKSNYTEPFVVIEFSESGGFDSNELLSFTEADLKFKEVERQDRLESIERYGKQYGYNKTFCTIYYLADEQDTELSAYSFRYDIGDYEETESGLYNHIAGFWDYAEKRVQEKQHSAYNSDDVDNAKHMLGILSPYKDTAFIPHAENTSDFEQDMQETADGSGGMVEAPAAAPRVKLLPQAPPVPEKLNYRFSEADNLFSGGAKTKFRNNIEAIRLVKHLETEGRLATADEQRILANYVGWGGLSNAFSKTAAGWENEYQELKLMLDEDEYKAAMNSTITAFYTEPMIAEYMYKALGSFGFNGGKNRTILEPALGTGNFFSVLPEALRGTKLRGVELDSITGRIARQLYQTADIQIQGFETTRFDDNSVDVIIGNIPFNSIKVYDKRYDEENFLIHDYFIAKSIDLLKPGGIMAVITSKGTMDKTDISAREYFAQRADLIGAVRLPNTAFKALSGTEVTADILFFQKLDHIRDIDRMDAPDWVYSTQQAPHYYRINQYFIDNPDMILGTMTRDHRMYGNQDGTACVAPEGQDLYAELEKAIGKLSAVFTAHPDAEVVPLQAVSEESPDEEKIEADEGTKNYTYVIKDDKIYFCEGGYLIPQDFKGVKAERIKGLCEIRSALLDVVGVQSREWGYQYNELEEAQKKLNEVYDAFVKKYGYINDKPNIAIFANDDQSPLLRSIEDLNDDKVTYRKAPIFTKATIKSYRQPTHAESAKEALEISLNIKLKVDLAYMAYLYEKSEDEIIAELGDRIYLNPQNYYGNPHEGWETAEEYLSGDVVSKLDYARLKAQDNEMFARNVTALQDVQPAKLLPSDIDFRIGSPWIPIEYYRKFMYETFETPAYLQPTDYTGSGRIELEYLEYTDAWRISSKGSDSQSVKANQTYGTGRANAYEIYEDCLNMQSVTIRDPVRYRDANGKEQTKYVINANETMIARSKQQLIKEAFGTWLFADKDRAEILLGIYNERFNRIRPREYDGSHLHFDGMSEERELRKHQKDVIARIVYNGTCLMAHEVGAGKTAAMIAAGIYMKNMGVIKKPLYVVPNHLIEQWANEFYRFFPSANILVTTRADFEKKSRNKFISKIAMGDYDAIIVSHSQFEKIPVSRERQERLLNEEISSLTRIIEQMKAEKGENWAVKQIVIFQNNLKDRLERLIKEERKDDLLNFEQLGVDYLFVDEAHTYKNCYTYTKMRNVAGIGQSKSQRASDMLMKCQYLQEVNKGKGITFATGTPISNSMSEMYVMQRFLQPEILKKTGLHFFDKWAATFGDTISSLEINPEGSGYRIKNRFSKFHNLPELMKLFRVIADIQTGDMLNLPVPEIDGGKAKVIVTERSEFQKKVMESFVVRAEAIRKRDVKPEEDNMLKLTNEAKLMAIDPRLVYSDAPNDPDSKLNTCIRNVFDIWRETADEKLTQVIFCDSGTPKPGQFNVYDEVKEQLIKMGVPADEIAFVHDAKTDAQREAMFEKTRKGEIRVMLGSTSKLGTGTNIQKKLCALHHLDVPWRPSDIIQRDGRGLRFGNDNAAIRIFRYVTKDTFDAYLWQIQEQKLRYITQIMTSKSVSRSCEDVDETVLTAAEIKAIATSNPLLAEKMTVDNEVTRLKLLKGNWTNERIVLERNINTHYPDTITRSEKRIEDIQSDIAVLDKHKGGDFIITIDGKAYDERTAAGEVLLTVIKAKCEVGEGQYPIGSYRGLDLYAERKNLYETDLRLMGGARYSAPASDSAIGCITRIENLAEKLPTFLSETETKLTDTKHQLETAKQAVTKPFDYEGKLSELLTRQSEINTRLEFKELSKQQDEVLSEAGAEDETNEDEMDEEYENDGVAV